MSKQNEQINKIAIAYDLSNYSIQAVDYGADLAESVNAARIIINVINQRDMDIFEKVRMHTDELNVNNYIRKTKAYRSEEIKKVFENSNGNPGLFCVIFRNGVPFREWNRALPV